MDIRNCRALNEVLSLDDTWACNSLDREAIFLLSIVLTLAVGGTLDEVDLSVEVWSGSSVDGGAETSSTAFGLWTSWNAIANWGVQGVQVVSPCLVEVGDWLRGWRVASTSVSRGDRGATTAGNWLLWIVSNVFKSSYSRTRATYSQNWLLLLDWADAACEATTSTRLANTAIGSWSGLTTVTTENLLRKRLGLALLTICALYVSAASKRMGIKDRLPAWIMALKSRAALLVAPFGWAISTTVSWTYV